jgi:hypothetical protein
MGILMDIRSGKRSNFTLGSCAILFWAVAGFAAATGLGIWRGVSTEQASLPFALIGLALGVSVGFYAAFGATRVARALALPGAALAIIGMVVGL